MMKLYKERQHTPTINMLLVKLIPHRVGVPPFSTYTTHVGISSFLTYTIQVGISSFSTYTNHQHVTCRSNPTKVGVSPFSTFTTPTKDIFF